MELAHFVLDNTLLAGDSDYEWAQFLIDRGVLDRATYEAENDRFFAQYKDGTLDIYEFLDFQLAPLARYPRAQLDAWHAEFMDAKIRPMIGPAARRLVARHLDAGTIGRALAALHRQAHGGLISSAGQARAIGHRAMPSPVSQQ